VTNIFYKNWTRNGEVICGHIFCLRSFWIILTFEIYSKNWRSDFILLLSSLPVDVAWNSHLKNYINSKHLYKNFVIVDAAYFFHKTVATFFRVKHVLWKSITSDVALISHPLPAPRSRINGAILLPSFFASFGMLQGDVYFYRKWTLLIHTALLSGTLSWPLWENSHNWTRESLFRV